MINLSRVTYSPFLSENFTINRILGTWIKGKWTRNVSKPILSAVLAAAGLNYHAGDVLSIIQAGASGGTITVTGVDPSTGVITTISGPTSAGTGYGSASALLTSGGHGSGCTVSITAGPANPLLIPSRGVVTVASDKDLTMIPEGDRVGGEMTFYSNTPIFLTSASGQNTSDQLEWPAGSGGLYRVMAVGSWDSFGFRKALAARMKGD